MTSTHPTAQTLDIIKLNVRLANGRRLLRDVSLTLKPGEVRALVGESGAGKSMIGKAVLGILPNNLDISEGEIILEGAHLNAMTPSTRRKTVAKMSSLIPQDPLTALNPVRKIGPQITDPLIRIHGWSADRAMKRARDLLDRVHIRAPERVMASYPHELSGGMRQRILIAAAFAPSPRLIVADEPTTALDVTVQKQILKLIRELQRETGTAVLFVTHDMGVVAKISQQVTVLFAGRVMEDAPTQQVFEAPSHPYTQALIKATPTLNAVTKSFSPVPAELIAELHSDIAKIDAAYDAGDRA
ncbi:ABC transporter ATP-binding protein [Pacificibacter marinus]|uniref:Oligopeptide transport ATP-binding protein OppD n=1 Tax=Pacificibacter marinus TaxID=658057 RepID=A0A1Y5TAS4_9RHOB|nr:ABC transporter ATP-binding protein [Pacificibacter marinus]SEL09744.1 peptide/nickel transport system ATP-binding protein [Pacificibacter marinus]SLN59337.1 Oligopeptide transport ATP-binding protein OppD [Pacificibacter marinus]